MPYKVSSNGQRKLQAMPERQLKATEHSILPCAESSQQWSSLQVADFGILFVRTEVCRTVYKQARTGCVGDMCELLTEYTVDKVGSGTCGLGLPRQSSAFMGASRSGVGPASSCVCLSYFCYFGSKSLGREAEPLGLYESVLHPQAIRQA